MNHNNIFFFLIYPYFNEPWIKTWLPEFNMLDYKVKFSVIVEVIYKFKCRIKLKGNL
jgi:hypothetical protein